MLNVLVIFGTRPEIIKMAPLVHAMNAMKEIRLTTCHTSQHTSMAEGILDFFDISPDYRIAHGPSNCSLASSSSYILKELNAVIDACQPDLTLVQGDTTSAFCGALASYYHKIPVGHVEAGLRTGNNYSPFPEEAYRRMISCLATYHFAPTSSARDALLRESIDPATIYETGNTVIDALFFTIKKIGKRKERHDDALNVLANEKPYVLVTGHRRESFGDGLQQICSAIKTLANKHRDVNFIYPVHLNPNIKQPVWQQLGSIDNVKLIEPLDYPDFVFLMAGCSFILTDSGGVQEEAPSIGKPVLVMRDTTERTEGIEAGTAILVGPRYDAIVEHASRLILNENERNRIGTIDNPYGDGLAASRITSIIMSNLFNCNGHV